jgi:hypothetical protein
MGRLIGPKVCQRGLGFCFHFESFHADLSKLKREIQLLKARQASAPGRKHAVENTPRHLDGFQPRAAK